MLLELFMRSPSLASTARGCYVLLILISFASIVNILDVVYCGVLNMLQVW